MTSEPGTLSGSASTTLAYRDFGVDHLGRGSALFVVDRSASLRTPFYRLQHFTLHAAPDGRPRILLVPPLSGHFPNLLRDMVVGLLPTFDVAVLDWANVRHVPARNGAFSFEDNIRAVSDAVCTFGPRVSVVALCQGGVPALAAVADLSSRRPRAAPASLALIAAPIDPLARPTPVVSLIRSFRASWYRIAPLSRVGREYRGAGRLVYPAACQAAGLEAYRTRHAGAEDELSRKFSADDGADPDRFPFEDLYGSLMDIDARHFADNIETVFLRRDLVKGRLCVGGRTVDPSSISGTRLLTIEGAHDDIAAPGQTSAALNLCTGLHGDARRALVVDCGHFGLFHGQTWRERVCPAIRDHCLESCGT